MSAIFSNFASGAQAMDDADTTLTWSHTVGSSDDILVVHVALLPGAAAVSSVTFGAESLTQVESVLNDAPDLGTGSYSVLSRVFALVGPTVGTDTITITMTGLPASPDFIPVIGQSASAQGVYRMDPWDGHVESTFSPASSVSNDVTGTNSRSLAVDFIAINASTTGTATEGADQTAVHGPNSIGSGDKILRAYMSTERGAGTNTMSWTLSSDHNGTHMAMELRTDNVGPLMFLASKRN